jgi:hypothetical protein
MNPHPFLGGHDLVHWVAAAVLVVGGVAAVALTAWSRAARRQPAGDVEAHGRTGGPAGTGAGRVILAGLSACAGFIHLAAAPGHYADLGDLAAGFLAAGVFQLAWAAKVAGSRRLPMSRRVRLLGLGGNAAIIAAWALARTVGIPPGHVDPIVLPDAAATAFEALIVVGIVVAAVRPLSERLGRARPLAAVVSIAVVPVLGLAIVVTSLATLAIAAGADHGLPSAASQHAVVLHR